jgi:uncharacterized membrane protein
MPGWLHPSLVHFPIGLLFAALVFDVVGLWRSNEKLVFAGYWNTLLGAAAAVVAVGSGLAAEATLGPTHALGGALLGFHKAFGLAAAVLAVVLAGARIAMKGYVLPRTRTLYLAGALLAAAFVMIGGTIGGVLVYGYGVGISKAAAERVVEAHAVPEEPEPNAGTTAER